MTRRKRGGAGPPLFRMKIRAFFFFTIDGLSVLSSRSAAAEFKLQWGQTIQKNALIKSGPFQLMLKRLFVLALIFSKRFQIHPPKLRLCDTVPDEIQPFAPQGIRRGGRTYPAKFTIKTQYSRGIDKFFQRIFFHYHPLQRIQPLGLMELCG